LLSDQAAVIFECDTVNGFEPIVLDTLRVFAAVCPPSSTSFLSDSAITFSVIFPVLFLMCLTVDVVSGSPLLTVPPVVLALFGVVLLALRIR
jgi:hypothetical protein